MALLNYTTKVPARQSAGEVFGLVARAGAQRITLVNDPATREPIGIEFEVATAAGPQQFRLPVRVASVLALIEPVYREQRKRATPEQAAAVGWRIVKDWTEAQLALIDTGMVKLEEVMLPYMLHPASGLTMFEAFEAHQFALPGAPVGDRG